MAFAAHGDLADADALLFWALDECTPHARRGHAYVLCEPGRLRWVAIEHSRELTPTLVELAARWAARHPADGETTLRRRQFWAAPDPQQREAPRRWSLHGDLGSVTSLLLGRELALELWPAGVCPLPPLPEAFLRRPIASLLELAIGPLHWPAALEPPRVCVPPRGLVSARAHDDPRDVVVCAARPGSIHADAGQERTAAVWRTLDAGSSWHELGWRLSAKQADSDAAKYNWPPETIERVTLVDGAPLIEWEDPWIDWEPGDRWQAQWQAGQCWHMSIRA